MSSFITQKKLELRYSFKEDPYARSGYSAVLLSGPSDRLYTNYNMFDSQGNLSLDYLSGLDGPLQLLMELDADDGGSGVDYGRAVTGTISGLVQGASALKTFKPKTEGEIIGDSGTSDAMAGGIGYTQQNAVNYGALMQEQSGKNTAGTMQTTTSGMTIGASVGSVFGPVGGAVGGAIGAVGGFITGLFKGKSAKRKLLRRIHNAQVRIDRNNKFNQAEAFTTGLQQDYAELYGDTGGLLYAKHGKDKFAQVKLRKRYGKK